MKLLHHRYHPLRTLRKTLFGKAKLAHDMLTDKPVAIKMSLLNLVQQGLSETGTRVLEDPGAELQVLLALNRDGGHPNVVGIVDHFSDASYSYIVLEFLSNGELLDLILAAQRFKTAIARKYLIQIVTAVQFMHGRGFCHLDLSPENLLLDEQLNLKLVDFGLARPLPPPEQNFPAEEANKPGKLGYMAPEIFFGLEFSGEAADVYSIGVILFIMLTGVPPYDVPSIVSPKFRAVYGGQMELLLEKWGFQLDPFAVDLLKHMLCPPSARYTFKQIMSHPFVVSGTPLLPPTTTTAAANTANES